MCGFQAEGTDMQGTGAWSHEIENIVCLLGEGALGATLAKPKFHYDRSGGGAAFREYRQRGDRTHARCCKTIGVSVCVDS